jgi:hypothetical protein
MMTPTHPMFVGILMLSEKLLLVTARRKFIRDAILFIAGGVVLEPTLKALKADDLIPYLPQVWFVILWGLALDALYRSDRVQEWATGFYKALSFRRKAMSFVIVGLIGLVSSLLLWWVIIGIFKARAGSTAATAEASSTPTPPSPTPTPASSSPTIKTLHDLYMADCKPAEGFQLRGTRMLTENDKPAYEVEYFICADLISRSKYIHFFLPDSDYTFSACKFLPSVYRDIMEKDSGMLPSIYQQRPGEREESAADLKDSGRVFVYHESYLLPSRIDELTQEYKKVGLSPQFRGRDYLILRNSPLYESRPSSQAVEQPSKSIPNIERKGTRGIRLPLEPETNRITSSNYKGEKHSLVACLAKFYYLPEPNTPDWVYITAHIFFYPGYESYKAFRPIWFETESNKQLFKRADTHELIIVMGGAPVLGGHQRWASYENSDREGYFHFEGIFDNGFRAVVELIIERDDYVDKRVFNYEARAKRRPNEAGGLFEV